MTEEGVATILGAIVVLVVGFLLFRYFETVETEIKESPCIEYTDAKMSDTPSRCIKFFVEEYE